MKIVRTIGASIGIALSFFYLGCGSVEIAQAGIPNISQIVPQSLSVGSSGVTVKVVGSNFSNQTVVLWNGGELPTTMVDSNTLTSPVQTANLSVPGMAQLQVQNFVSGQKSQTVPLTIASSTTNSTASLSITTTSLPSSTSGTPYSFTLAAGGGTPGYTWSITSGKLPVEMSLAPSTGVLSGTPSTPGSFSFGVAVSDQSNPVQTKSATLTFVVLPKPLTITTRALPSVGIGVAYSQTVAAVGGSTPYHWSITSGTLPPGLSLTAAKGIISGTPSAAGNYPFTIAVTDKSGSKSTSTLAISVIPNSLNITTASLPSGTVGTGYSSALGVTGGTPGYTWSISAGTLPAGLALGSNGVISGIPSASGTSTFTATVRDSSIPALTQSAQETIVVSSTALQIAAASLAPGTVNTAYSSTLTATGGTPGYTWSVSAGTLPAGVILASNGIISGTPTTSGTYSFTASVHDSGNPVQTQSATETIVIAAAALKIATSSLPSAIGGKSYSQTLSAVGGTLTYKWAIASGSLPAGLSLAPSTGVISGTPTTSGSSSFTATVSDSSSPTQVTSAALTVVVSGSTLSITSSTLSAATVGTAYSQTLQANGGTVPYTWSVSSGQLPAGLSLAPSSGIISGTPTSGAVSSSFVVSVSDSSSSVQSATASTSIAISAPSTTALSITSSTLPSGTGGSPYSATLQATGGTPAYTWSIKSGSLPAGLTLASTTGVISGTPTASGTSTFTASVSDNGSPVQTQSMTTSITVNTATATGTGTTWYIRTDGGTSLQCTGKTNAPYTGGTSQQWNAGTTYAVGYQIVDSNNNLEQVTTAGTSGGEYPPGWNTVKSGTTSDNGVVWTNMGPLPIHQACAVNNPMWLTTTNTPAVQLAPLAWVPTSGDVIQFEDLGPYYVGSAYPNETQGSYFYNCLTNGFGCSLPSLPSGVSMWGLNKGACTNQANRTVLAGIGGAQSVLDIKGSDHADLECLDITDNSNCAIMNGSHNKCQSGGEFSQTGHDWAVTGIVMNNTTTHATLNDIRVHGMASSGIVGSPGDGFVATDLAIIGNAFAGWFSDNTQTGVGSMLVQNFNISWNGCTEELPIVDPLPYYQCQDDAFYGYGDGFGTASIASNPPGWQIHFENGIVSYNTQDGLDTLHNSGTGSSITETRILAYGNEGQQIKGGSAISTLQNNVIVGNCEALAQTMPGRPVPTYDQLGDLCRGSDVTVVMIVSPGLPQIFQNNTVFSDDSIVLQVNYSNGLDGPTNTMQINNNVLVGFWGAPAGGNPTPIYGIPDLNFMGNPGSSWSNNVTYGMRGDWACPHAGESAAICTSPGLVDMAYHLYGYGNMAPASSSSPVIGAGITEPGVTLDYTGLIRTSPPSIGAYDAPSTP